jgi:tetraacyldisaccharide 4'-kinase
MQRYWLFPFSLLLHAVLKIRHVLFDWGIFSSKEGVISSIVIGNLNIGGTGKTPFTNMLLTDLQKEHTLAFLSRGYGRRSKGFKKIEKMDDAETVGDEPLLIAQRHSNLSCFVGENRVASIEKIQRIDPHTQWIVLDDAFQHRALKPNISILLTRYSQLFTEDQLWPVGNLRDLKSAARKADAIVITSTPLDCSEEERESKRKSIRQYCKGEIFFAQTQYQTPLPVFEKHQPLSLPLGAFCGIAQPKPFLEYVQQHLGATLHRSFPDHHPFSAHDLTSLEAEMVNFDSKINTWITTEKDAMRLRHLKEWQSMNIFYLPIETTIHPEDQVLWNQWLTQKMRK